MSAALVVHAADQARLGRRGDGRGGRIGRGRGRGNGRRGGEKALVGEQLHQRLAVVGPGDSGAAAHRHRCGQDQPERQGGATREGGFASARRIGEPMRPSQPRKRLVSPRISAGCTRLGYRRRRRCKHRRGASCSRPCCSKRTKAGFVPVSARSTRPACPKAMSGRRSRTRRSTSRTAWRSPTAARWCAPGRWSPASTAPAPCSRPAMPTGSRATASCTTAGAWARRAGAASPSAPA